MSKTILITGASTGFGRTTAETLDRAGHTVFASMRDPKVKNRGHADTLQAKGIEVVKLDVTDTQSVDQVVAMKRRTIAGFTVAALTMATMLGVSYGGSALAESAPDWGPKWTAAGELKLPRGFHTWVFLGAPLTPNALNGGKAAFPEYHNVYIQPEAYKVYRKTKEFPEGTILLKELQLTLPGSNTDGSRVEPSGRGYFPATSNGIDISVKDSKKFKETNGWGFFNFGHHAPPYAKTAAKLPKDACAGCHIDNATNMVFSKFYAPILDAK